MEPRPKKLLEQVEDAIRPRDMGTAEVQAFLTHLAVDQNVAASTQNQTLSALLFLYRQILHQPLDLKVDAVCARKPEHLPTVLSRKDVKTTMIYRQGAFGSTHVLNRGPKTVRSPLD